ncbi:MAG: alkaline phosphatase family protein [Methyloprofundus sp.]|nr:alkaline phosphatase family protein [Methyloprofundus sp.]
MKMLLIGMDGAQEASFKRGWTPFIESLIGRGQSLDLKEDLISRGWAEIMTGQHGLVTDMLYERPTADGTLGWTEKSRLQDIPGLGTKVKPIWQILNEQGFKVGIMNVPTTYPAPEVDGFFVSGGGGGGPVNQDVTEAQCHPKSLKDKLASSGYIVDERISSLLGDKQLYNPADFFSRLELMTEKRTDTFIQNSKDFEVNFGFVVYRSSVTAETFIQPQTELFSQENKEIGGPFFEAVEQFYRHFDEQVKRLVESFPESEVVLVSDHSMVTRKWSVNTNEFLVEQGWQQKSSSRRGVYDFVKSFKHLIPHAIRQKLKSNPKVRSAYESMVTFDPKVSQAFSMAFSTGVHGIYINDSKRFGGPVEQDQIGAVSVKIIEAFNAHPTSVEYGLKAYKKSPSNEGCSDIFPDIYIQVPDGYLTSNEFSEFVSKHPLPDELVDFREITKTGNYCIKGRSPLAVNVKGEWLLKPNRNKQDLTLIYDQIAAFFKAKI